MTLVNPLTYEATGVWLSHQKFDEAESAYQKYLSDGRPDSCSPASPNTESTKRQAGSGLLTALESMRSKISDVLNTSAPPTRKSPGVDTVADRLQYLETENTELRKVTSDLRALVIGLEKRIVAIEGVQGGQQKAVAPPKVAAVEEDDDDDDDVDIFGESSAAEQKENEERFKAQKEKPKKPAPVAKSNLILDVKPWDDETDMAELEQKVRSVTKDGLLWGASKLVEIGYGIKKLQISCVIEDDKVFTDDIEESLTAFEDIIQSMDIAAFNKV